MTYLRRLRLSVRAFVPRTLSRKRPLESITRLRLLPARIVFQRENLLNAFRSAAGLIVQHLERLADFLDARIVGQHLARFLAAIDAIKNGGDVEQFAACFEEVV